ncbi:hypothetical protein BJ322DRAFT_1022944 [Thelephora terrestris]|uniref:Uncharacterized protein n=1 Tax=Thelephora terrestris TaxID=56493 RepID=A0A9P6L3T3_9AGAM|nr:hypothetical protein BJ322DRAFT_1022944 [Thelephora terrestris]
MPRAKAVNSTRSGKPTLEDIDWAKNKHELVFALLDQLERPENFKVLFGKKDPSEVNTSRRSKTAMFKSIAEALFPEQFAGHADQLTARVKSRIETLRKQYNTHARRLRKTGEGVQHN